MSVLALLLPSFGDQDRNHAKWISRRGREREGEAGPPPSTPPGPINLWRCERARQLASFVTPKHPA